MGFMIVRLEYEPRGVVRVPNETQEEVAGDFPETTIPTGEY